MCHLCEERSYDDVPAAKDSGRRIEDRKTGENKKNEQRS